MVDSSTFSQRSAGGFHQTVSAAAGRSSAVPHLVSPVIKDTSASEMPNGNTSQIMQNPSNPVWQVSPDRESSTFIKLRTTSTVLKNTKSYVFDTHLNNNNKTIGKVLCWSAAGDCPLQTPSISFLLGLNPGLPALCCRGRRANRYTVDQSK